MSDSDNYSDRLSGLKGSDYSDFDQEDLDKMYRSSMMAPTVANTWGKEGAERYRQTYGDEAWNEFSSQIDYSKYGNLDHEYESGQAASTRDSSIMEALATGRSIQDKRKGKLSEEQQMWDRAREAAGIKKVNSPSDIAEIRDKMNREMMGRMVGAGLDGYAKTEDLDALKQEGNSEPVKYEKSDTLKNAEDSIKGYNENEGNNSSQGDLIFNNSYRADTGGFEDYTFKPKSNAQDYADSARNTVKSAQKEVGLVTRGPDMGSVANGQGYTTDADSTFDYDDSKSYANNYKLKVANNLKPTNQDGSIRPSKAGVMKNSLTSNAFGG